MLCQPFRQIYIKICPLGISIFSCDDTDRASPAEAHKHQSLNDDKHIPQPKPAVHVVCNDRVGHVKEHYVKKYPYQSMDSLDND